MADESKKAEASDAAQSPRVNVRLVPGGDSDVPLLANVARLQMSAAAAIVDFGFIEPAPFRALARRARAEGKTPESVNGRLVARMALTSDALLSLHQQLDRAVKNLQASRNKTKNA